LSETTVKLLRIHGRVQGVWFRAWTEREAQALNLRGWVRNRHDGSVEVLVIGPPDDVTEMIRRCRSGPRLAQVDAVNEQPADDDGSTGFHTADSV